MADETEQALMRALDTVEATIEAVLIEDAAQAAQHAAEIAPVYSGGYQANIRAGLNTSDFPVEPSEAAIRAEQQRIARGEIAPGRLALPPSDIAERARATLRTLVLGEEIVIGNAVSYAGQVEDRGTATVPGGHVFRLTAEAFAAAFESRW